MIYLNAEEFDLDEELTINFAPRDSIEESYLRYDFTNSPPQDLYMNLTYYSTHADTYMDDDSTYDWDFYKFIKKENKKFMVVRFTAIMNVVTIKHFNQKLNQIVTYILLILSGLLYLIGMIVCIYYCCKKKF